MAWTVFLVVSGYLVVMCVGIMSFYEKRKGVATSWISSCYTYAHTQSFMPPQESIIQTEKETSEKEYFT